MSPSPQSAWKPPATDVVSGGSWAPPAEDKLARHYDAVSRGAKAKGTPGGLNDSFFGTIDKDIAGIPAGLAQTVAHPIDTAVAAFHQLMSLPADVVADISQGKWGKLAARVTEVALPGASTETAANIASKAANAGTAASAVGRGAVSGAVAAIPEALEKSVLKYTGLPTVLKGAIQGAKDAKIPVPMSEIPRVPFIEKYDLQPTPNIIPEFSAIPQTALPSGRIPGSPKPAPTPIPAPTRVSLPDLHGLTATPKVVPEFSGASGVSLPSGRVVGGTAKVAAIDPALEAEALKAGFKSFSEAPEIFQQAFKNVVEQSKSPAPKFTAPPVKPSNPPAQPQNIAQQLFEAAKESGTIPAEAAPGKPIAAPASPGLQPEAFAGSARSVRADKAGTLGADFHAAGIPASDLGPSGVNVPDAQWKALADAHQIEWPKTKAAQVKLKNDIVNEILRLESKPQTIGDMMNRK